MSDPVIRDWVEQWWDAASGHIPLPAEDVAAYRTALRERFGNANIHHLLAQIAADGSQKLPIRIVPVIDAELAAGRVNEGAIRPIAAWAAHLRGHGAPVNDVRAEEMAALVAGPADVAVARLVEWLGIDDARVVPTALDQLAALAG